jgi:DNA-binding LytR/AlgR family response regulator
MAGRPSDESVIARFGSKVADRVYKPIPGASFGDPLAFASRQTATRRTENILEVLSSRPKLRSLQLSRIAIKTKGTILFIDSSDVIAIEAKGNHLLLLHASGPYLLRESITTAEKKLNRHGFVRIQRSVLINPMFVHELKSWSAGRYVLRIKGGKEYKVTRNYKRNLQLLAESWIGTDGFGAT